MRKVEAARAKQQWEGGVSAEPGEGLSYGGGSPMGRPLPETQPKEQGVRGNAPVSLLQTGREGEEGTSGGVHRGENSTNRRAGGARCRHS